MGRVNFMLYFCIIGFITVSADYRKTYSDIFKDVPIPKNVKPTSYDTEFLVEQIQKIVKGNKFNQFFDEHPEWKYDSKMEQYFKTNDNMASNVRVDNSTIVPYNTSNDNAVSTVAMTTAQDFTENMTMTPTTPELTTPFPLVVSKPCMNHTLGFIEGVIGGKPWALQMIDAAGKPESNILGGGVTWVGAYDECLSVRASYNSSQETVNFNGEYCIVTLYNVRAKYIKTLNVGGCFPASCSETDVSNLVNTVLPAISGESVFAINTLCQEPDRPFDTRAIIVIVVCSLFIAMMVIGTGYDVIMLQIPKWNKEDIEEGKKTEIDENSRLINGKRSAEYQPGMGGKILLSFSVYTNASKILNPAQGAGSLTAINGIRFITMTWVILGHTCIFAIQFQLVDNTAEWLQDRLSRISFGPIYNAFPAVDTFFALSGLLLTYLLLKELKKNNGKMNWPMFYFHRFWRLTPPYMLIMMVYVSLFPYIGEGPGWRKDGVEVDYCKHSWHRNLLYVNNLFVDGYDMCMGWSWYLANDMQFFIISPLIIVPLFYYHLVGVVILIIFLLGAVIACGTLSAHYDLPASIFDGGNSAKFFNEYVKPWNRIGPYLVGMYAGYILYRVDCKYRMNKYVNLCAWIFFTALACTVLYGLHEDVSGNRLSTDIAALYTATHRIVWRACICWVIFACATGNGGFINTILSWKALVPLSRLTYCAYLVHPIIIYYYLLRRHRLIHFSDTEVAYEFVGHLVFSYAVAFVSSLAFESPMMGLEKVLLKRKERHR